MTFQNKRRIDYWLGGFLLALLYLPVRCLGLLLRRDHSTSRRRGCVVIKMVGAGSLFLAMPSMNEIRRRFPSDSFYLVGTPAVINVARGLDWFDEYWTIDDSSLVKLVKTSLIVLWRMGRRTDHLIDLEVHSRLTTVFSVLSMVRNRIGFVDEIVFWRRGFYTHMTFFNVHGPVYLFYDLLASWFGIDTVGVTKFNSRFRDQIMRTAQPEGTPPSAPYIAVGHGCSDFGVERKLRPEEWGRLLGDVELVTHDIVFLGAAADSAEAEAIIAVMGRGRNLCGRFSIAQSAHMIAHASLYYGIDSMLLHMARSLGVPTVSAFGPTDPATRLRRLSLLERVEYVRLPCSPCIHVNETPPCNGSRDCMALAFQGLMSNSRPVPSLEPHRICPALGWTLGPSEKRVRAARVSAE
ncbi:ADP-heptose:LPS heptosyltransferase [Bradyrhizobium sp. i1.8.4]|uniref:glycosyltransferase family 9 protein n=1 Tax=unclassified Bradyrhizobium TaxID=2631580 RepID=UPI003D1C4A61